MQHRLIELSQHRLNRSKEDFETAKINFENGFFKASINRSYYAIFHAIRAVNAINKFDSKKHSGVISHFNQFFVHTGKFDKEIFKIVTTAYKIREQSDYNDFYIASTDDAKVQIDNAAQLIEAVENYLNELWKEMEDDQKDKEN